VHEGKVFNLIVDEVEYVSGRASIREVAEHPGGSVALAMFSDESLLLIKQHRYPFNEFVWELPAGKLEKGEDPLHCAQRELEEETGYLAQQWKKLTSIYTTPGFCSEVLHIFLATEVTRAPGGKKLEEGEQTMTTHTVALAEAIAMIENGTIVDSKTICGILLAERLLRKG
jgi:ADP-ribose pyrophosphatase